MAEFIVIKADQSVSVSSEPGEVSIEIGDSFVANIDGFVPFTEIVAKSLPSIDSSIVQEMQKRQQREPVICNAIFPPDAWLLAVAYIMWEGILQGMSWDGTKLLVQNAIATMQSVGIAPRQVGELKNEKGFKFAWSGQLEISSLVKLHAKLEAKYSSMSETEKSKATRRTKKK